MACTTRARDHPRIGGEKAELTTAVISAMGSPPRRRGKEQRQLRFVDGVGITPAWARKRHRLQRLPSIPGDHPRVGGEKRRLSECAQWAEGSPPRGRGKVPCTAGLTFVRSITPAWAGKSCPDTGWCGCSRDHPRIGGEKQCSLFEVCAQEGSPLRRRGKEPLSFTSAACPGITPAWAGKSLSL